MTLLEKVRAISSGSPPCGLDVALRIDSPRDSAVGSQMETDGSELKNSLMSPTSVVTSGILHARASLAVVGDLSVEDVIRTTSAAL